MLFPKKQKRKKDPYALVLGGGGAKGAFQIGALKALNEFGIEFEAASGASVGALNAALVAMGDPGRAEELWKGLTIEDIVVVPDGLLKEGKLDFSIRNLLKLRSAGRKIFKDFGLDTAPLRALIARYADEKAVRSGGVDLGLVTFEISDLSPRELFLEDIPEGKLVDYLLASASFPLFKRAEINGKKFTDGGVYDNIPYAMIKERGYRKIIVIDVSGLGLNRRPNITGTETIYIKNSIDMGSVFDFSKGFITDFMRLGYLDTLKVFGKLSGIRYFYDDDPRSRPFLKNTLTRRRHGYAPYSNPQARRPRA
jgi:NTE family protein